MLEENVTKGGHITVSFFGLYTFKKKRRRQEVKLFLLIYLKNKTKIGR